MFPPQIIFVVVVLVAGFYIWIYVLCKHTDPDYEECMKTVEEVKS